MNKEKMAATVLLDLGAFACYTDKGEDVRGAFEMACLRAEEDSLPELEAYRNFVMSPDFVGVPTENGKKIELNIGSTLRYFGLRRTRRLLPFPGSRIIISLPGRRNGSAFQRFSDLEKRPWGLADTAPFPHPLPRAGKERVGLFDPSAQGPAVGFCAPLLSAANRPSSAFWTGIFMPMKDSMAASRSAMPSPARDMALPEFPARAVRPIRWT